MSVRDTSFAYDALNRVITETSAGLTHAYEYDKAGNRTHVEYGGTGRTIESEYDALNRLAEINEEASGGGGTRTTEYLRDLSGNLVKKSLPNGTVERRTHDALNRPSEIETVIPGTPDTVLLHQEYAYDEVGNVRHIEESYPGGTLPAREITNTYDGTYRLLEEEIQTSGSGTVTTTYAYDDGNNRTSKVVDSGPEAGTTTYVIGDGTNGAGTNQIKQASLPDTTVVEYTYDLNGNRLTRDDGTQDDACTYDYEQRLVELVRTGGSGAGTYEYAYDARTRRVVRDESGASGVETKVVFSGGTSVQEYDLTTTPALTVEYLRGHDWGGGVGGILYTIRSGVESYAHSSARGDVVSRTDDTGDITWEAQYEAFGRHPDQAGTNPDRQRANSKDEDPTGLLNEGFRYRDLQTGAFITRDPAGFVDGPNLYTYVRQNPWTSFDPKGLKTEVEKALEKPIAIARAADPRIDQMFKVLEASSHTHYFKVTKDPSDVKSNELAGNLKQRENLENGVGLGSEVHINLDPQSSRFEKGIVFAPEDVVAHEAYHSFLTDIGMSTEATSPRTGAKVEEEEAVRIQNLVRKKMGAPTRTQVEDIKIGEPEALIQHPDADFVGKKLNEREALLKEQRAYQERLQKLRDQDKSSVTPTKSARQQSDSKRDEK